MKLTIGDVTLENNVILAPMAGVTDLPFRLLCKEQGAGLLCMEMVSAKAVHYNNKNTEALLEIHPEEKPVSLQLFGSEPDIMAETAARIEERPFAILDVNMGCPVPKVVNNHEGSALMKDPQLAGQIIHALVQAIHKPVTVKIRKGFDDAHVNAVEMAKIAEANGAAAIAVHGRTREQYYSGKADWDIIRQVKEAVSIPVIGNGDVVDALSAKKMMDSAAQGFPRLSFPLIQTAVSARRNSRISRRSLKSPIFPRSSIPSLPPRDTIPSCWSRSFMRNPSGAFWPQGSRRGRRKLFSAARRHGGAALKKK